MQVLLVEDDRPLSQFLRKAFGEEGYATDVVADGETALERALTRSYDCVVLDLMLPERDGFSVVEELRRRAVNVPVLMLTARHEVDHRIKGLEVGADDYLSKPFDLAELLARMHALMRRSQMRHEDAMLTVGTLTLDPLRRHVERDGRTLDLSARELALLEFLMRNAGRTVSRARIAEAVWQHQFDTDTNVVDVYINYLRKKLTFQGNPPPIKTVRGVGYRLDHGD